MRDSLLQSKWNCSNPFFWFPVGSQEPVVILLLNLKNNINSNKALQIPSCKNTTGALNTELFQCFTAHSSRDFFFKEFVFLLIFLSNSKEAVYEISPKSEIKLPLVICTALVFLVTTPSTISKVWHKTNLQLLL